jgi:hypothetical protein
MGDSEEELRKELEETQRQLEREKVGREAEFWKSEVEKRAIKDNASANFGFLVLFGGIAVVFLALLL